MGVFLFTLSMQRTMAQTPVPQRSALEALPPGTDWRSLSPEQVDAILRDRNKPADEGTDRNARLADTKKPERRDSLPAALDFTRIKPEERTYGDNVFADAAATDMSELSIPPADYPIGVGDHLIISLWGGAELQEEYVVSRDGSIFPKGVGKIVVQGLGFEEARSLIVSRMKRVTPSSTRVAVSLGQPRTINVNVVGNVLRPGPVTVSAFSNAFNVIARAGGVNEWADLRTITIRRGGVQVDELDVYEYLHTGNLGKKAYLQNNDFVVVGYVQRKVKVTGAFRRPMYYQLKPGDQMADLFSYAGGLLPTAQSSAVKVFRTQNEAQRQRDLDANDPKALSAFELFDGDVVQAGSIPLVVLNRVEVLGEVKYPGLFEVRPGERLTELIRRAGGLTGNTYLDRAFVFRGAADSTNYSSTRIDISLRRLMGGDSLGTENPVIYPFDRVQFFSNSEFGQQPMVDVFGEVRRPGKIRRFGHLTLQDALYLSGGLKPSAELGRVEVSSIVNVDSARQGLNPTRTVVRTFAIQSDLSLDSAAARVLLMPYDQIYIRSNPDFQLQQNIEIKGLVRYPGQYPRLDKLERLSSFINRAGGLMEHADINGAVLIRRKLLDLREVMMGSQRWKKDSLGNAIIDSLPEELRFRDEPVSIDLRKAMDNPRSSYDIVLQENDVVFVPEINPFVNITGNVQSPVKVSYEKNRRNSKYYIDKAGGYGVRPWRKRVYVTYANGKSRRTRNFLFLHFYPRVQEGSVVTVPERPKGQEFNDLLKTALLSTISVITTAVIFKYIN